MKRAVWLVLGASMIGWGIAGALGGCSSEEPEPVEEPDSGDTPSTSGSPGPSGPSSSSGGTSSSGGPTDDLDAGDEGDADAAPSPPASNPGKVTCGATECDAGNRCCWPENDASAGVCGNFCMGANDFEILCDEKADCPNPNERCCLFYGESRCAVNCAPGGNIQLCKTDAECANDAGCSERSCARGAGDDIVILRLRVCGKPANCE